MKVLLINNYDLRGGAGIVSYRLFECVINQNHQVKFLVNRKQSSHELVQEINRSWQQKIDKLLSIMQSLVGLQYICIPFAKKNLLSLAIKFKPDIISLHNSHGGYFPTSLLHSLSRIAPVCWTLHDVWAISGHSALFLNNRYDDSKDGYPTIGIDTSVLLKRYKKNIYQKSNLTVITPSKWLANLVKSSDMLNDKRIFTIVNGVDTNIFFPKRTSTRRLFNLLVGAESLSIKNKGISHLLQNLNSLDKKLTKKIRLTIYGKTAQKKMSFSWRNIEVEAVGYICSQKEMAQLMQKSDLLLYPSLADNLPNTLVEATCCGLPAITYNVGGCSEIIESGQNGYVVDNYKQMEVKILELVNNPGKLKEMSIKARKIGLSKFDIKIMSDAYISLFKNVIDK